MDLYNLLEINDLLTQLIPEGEQKFTENGVEYTISRKGNEVSIHLKNEDSPIKKKIDNFKKIIDELSDCMFVDIMSNLSEEIDKVALNKILNQTSFTDEDIKYIENSFDTIFEEIGNCLKTEISKLMELYNQLEICKKLGR